jgi:hypothetical protein
MNILLIAFEDEGRLLSRLAMRFKAKGHNVFIASCDHYYVTHTRGQLFDYYRSLGLTDSEFTHLGALYRELNTLPLDMPRDSVDWKYLAEFESRYAGRFTLQEMVVMDPLMSGAYHHRNIYFRPKNKNLFFKNLELHVRWIEDIFNRCDFDFVFSVNFQYFIKATAFAIATGKHIPFLTLASCRIKDLYLISDNFGIGTSRAIRDEMERLRMNEDPCREGKDFIDWINTTRKSATKSFDLLWVRELDHRMALSVRLRVIRQWLTRIPIRTVFVHKHYRGYLKRNYFLPSFVSILRVTLTTFWRRIAYFCYKQLNHTDLPSEPFVFFPLHVIPENTVITLSKTFNEMECLFQISKVLPVNWKVVVKVNPEMLVSQFDSHPIRYYLEMNRLPNVQFISPKRPSGDIIQQAAAVACISGTALLEGAMHGKPSFRWGRPEFEAVDTIYEFHPDRVRQHLKPTLSGNLTYYIQACHNNGLHLDMDLLTYAGASPLSPERAAEQEQQLLGIEGAIWRNLQEK